MKKFLVTTVFFFAVVSITTASTITSNFKSLNFTKKTLTINAFCKLIQMGDYEAVKSLINEGVDVNKKSNGLTPLMFAARHNRVKIAKLLIANGAKLKMKSDKGFTALKYAELSNATEAKIIIEHALIAQKNKRKNRMV
ncbi:ankyrin repeat domain-containing protein [Lutibacter sp. TH_r2]|uniref:ankyrin repeat domain-containing protein n=1 Tax=Lutibacter sp. TH_r2 TaxID=3082083 RepID=UPI0029548E06|nr:ankyrin repeat domain-containing protein [Lutibacter sp. TH_r2]MDV7186133.1 ankyrin repeat domain-containing protein [Lutibacter sp. TH_r2]